MKKMILLLSFCAASLSVFAQTGAWEIIDRMGGIMREYGNYRMDFTASAKGMPGSVGGMYVVSGDKYYIKVQKQEQFSDGQTRWEVNPSDKEVVIDYIDLDNRNILQNPTKAFDFAPGEFTAEYRGIETVKDMACYAIKLTPTGRMYGIGVVDLYVSVAAEIPVAITYDFEGERLTVRIDKFTAVMTADESQFVFDESKYKGYEIIDFR